MFRHAALLILLILPQDKDDKLQKAVNRLAKRVERLVGVKFKSEVKVELQSPEDFEKRLRESVKERDPEEGAAPSTVAYQLLGLLPAKTDPVKDQVKLMQVQTGAYYDPRDKKIIVINKRMDAKTLVALLFHELVHALQDQHHDLTAIRKKLRGNKNHDQLQAFRFLVEGEASFWTRIYQLNEMGDDFMKLPAAAQRLAFSSSKSLTTKGIIRMLTYGADKPGASKTLKAAAANLKMTPPILVRKHNDPYLRGMWASYKIWSADKRSGLRKMFTDLPACTRDMMFADNWKKSPRSTATIKPASIKGDLGESWRLLFEDTGGAITWHTLFEQKKSLAATVAKDWDGDRLQVWKNGEDSILVGIVAFRSKRAMRSFGKGLERLFKETWHAGEKAPRHRCKGTHLHVGRDHLVVRIREKDKLVIFARGNLPGGEACKKNHDPAGRERFHSGPGAGQVGGRPWEFRKSRWRWRRCSRSSGTGLSVRPHRFSTAGGTISFSSPTGW